MSEPKYVYIKQQNLKIYQINPLQRERGILQLQLEREHPLSASDRITRRKGAGEMNTASSR